MRNTIVLAVLFLAVSASASGVEVHNLFIPSYEWTGEEWDPFTLKAEPVLFNREAIAPQRQAPYRVKTLATSEGKTLSFTVDGIGYRAATIFTETNTNGTFWLGVVEGTRVVSYIRTTGSFSTVGGEVWTPQGHRSLMTRKGVVYLVERDEEAISRLLVNDFVEPDKGLEVESDASSYRKRRAVRVPSNPRACAPDMVQNTDQLWLYTPEALAWFGTGKQAEEELAAAAQNGVDGFNATVINTTGELKDRLVMVHITPAGRNDESASGGDQHNMLRWLSESPEVRAIMEQHKADSAYLLLGMYLDVGGTAMPGFAVSPVHFGVLPMIHENGHALKRMGHDPDNWNPPPSLPIWAVDHVVPGVGRGVMAYPTNCTADAPCPWQPVFAMWGVFYPDTQVQSGIRDVRENGRMLAWMRNHQSNFAYVRTSGDECVAESFDGN